MTGGCAQIGTCQLIFKCSTCPFVLKHIVCLHRVEVPVAVRAAHDIDRVVLVEPGDGGAASTIPHRLHHTQRVRRRLVHLAHVQTFAAVVAAYYVELVIEGDDAVAASGHAHFGYFFGVQRATVGRHAPVEFGHHMTAPARVILLIDRELRLGIELACVRLVRGDPVPHNKHFTIGLAILARLDILLFLAQQMNTQRDQIAAECAYRDEAILACLMIANDLVVMQDFEFDGCGGADGVQLLVGDGERLQAAVA